MVRAGLRLGRGRIYDGLDYLITLQRFTGDILRRSGLRIAKLEPAGVAAFGHAFLVFHFAVHQLFE